MGKLLLLGAGLLAVGFLAGADAAASLAVPLGPEPPQEWSPSRSYNHGDIVLYQGKRYKWMLPTTVRAEVW